MVGHATTEHLQMHRYGFEVRRHTHLIKRTQQRDNDKVEMRQRHPPILQTTVTCPQLHTSHQTSLEALICTSCFLPPFLQNSASRCLRKRLNIGKINPRGTCRRVIPPREGNLMMGGKLIFRISIYKHHIRHELADFPHQPQ